MSEMIERKYALAKIKAGDYLLPGNDGKTLWRITKGEDGPSYGLDPEQFPKDFTVWQVWRWTGRQWPGTANELRVDLDGRWEFWAGDSDSREQAIQAALRAELPKPKPKRKRDPRPAGRILVGAFAKAPSDG